MSMYGPVKNRLNVNKLRKNNAEEAFWIYRPNKAESSIEEKNSNKKHAVSHVHCKFCCAFAGC